MGLTPDIHETTLGIRFDIHNAFFFSYRIAQKNKNQKSKI